MRIERKAITEEILSTIYLLKPQNERFLKWEKLVFWDDVDKLQDDFSSRIPLTILLIVLCLLGSIFLAYYAWRYQLFATQAVTASEELFDKNIASLGNNNQYYLSYRYNYGAEQFSRTYEVRRAEYDNALLGNRREVLILPTNRDQIIGGMNEILIPLLLLSTFLIVITAITVYQFYRWYRKIQIIPAKITEVEQGEKHTNRGVTQTFELSYEFASPRTKTLLKARKSIPIRQNAPSTEQLLAVLYRNDTDFLPL